MWMMPGGNRHYQGLEGYVRRCSFLYMSGVNEPRKNRGESSWKGLADVVHVSKPVSIHQRPLI
jgi:hypothetical protein